MKQQIRGCKPFVFWRWDVNWLLGKIEVLSGAFTEAGKMGKMLQRRNDLVKCVWKWGVYPPILFFFHREKMMITHQFYRYLIFRQTSRAIAMIQSTENCGHLRFPDKATCRLFFCASCWVQTFQRSRPDFWEDWNFSTNSQDIFKHLKSSKHGYLGGFSNWSLVFNTSHVASMRRAVVEGRMVILENRRKPMGSTLW